MAFGPRSIRGKTACVATAVTAVAMVLTVAVVALATRSVLMQSIEDSLNDRIDAVAQQVEQGDISQNIAGTGSELVQVIDESGAVVGASDWASGVSAISEGAQQEGHLSRRVDDMELEREELPENVTVLEVVVDDGQNQDEDDNQAQDTQDDSASSSDSASPPQPSAPAPQAPVAPSDGGGDSGYGDSGFGDSGYDSASATPGPLGMLRVGFASISGLLDSFFDEGIRALVPARVAWASDAQAVSDGSSDQNQSQGADADSSVVDSLPASRTTIRATDLFGSEGPFLVVERGVQTPSGTMTVAAMASLASATDAAKTAAALLAAVLAVALVLVATLSWLLAARTLRPVERMRAAADAISIGDLSGRIPVPEKDADLSKLAGTFNAMLARLEASVAEQRRFVSDASHELKSPVAAIRVMLETMRDHPEAVDPKELLEDLMGENERVSGIVGDLLLLARHDEGVSRLDKEPIDMCDLLYEEATLLKGRTAASVDVSDVQPIVCQADREALSHAVRNLLDNAARYATSRVKLSCDQEGDAVRIVVSDDGRGIAPADRERVFGRFVRLEEGRSRKEGSTGLGLAVVKTVAEQHGGTASFVDPEIGGATAVLSIPVS